MAALSAGLLLYRGPAGQREVFLVHPGGPYWAKKDEGAWSVPKGLVEPGEDELAAAWREFQEETGLDVSAFGAPLELGTFVQPSGKRVRVWAVEGDCDPAQLRSNLCAIEWPPRSGRMRQFPEVDRGGWFDAAAARRKILAGQQAVLDRFFGSGG